tara:strand:+ start:1081 stop:2364 length:1284 start_codon:yes stop_codon:yes gene_type:complete
MNKELNYIDLIIKYLILSIPILLIAGPLLAEIAIAIIFFLILPKLKEEFQKFNKIFIYGFLFFYLFIVLGSLLSDYKFLSLKSTLFYFRFIILILSIHYILSKSSNFLKLLKNFLLIIFFLLIVDGFYQYFFEENIFGYSNVNKSRVSSFFGKELIYGSYLLRFLPILIGLLIFFHDNNKDKILIYFVIFVSILAIFISGERAAFILSIICLTIIITTTNFFNNTKLYFFLTIFLMLSGIILTNEEIKKKWKATISNSFLNLSDNKIIFEDKKYPLILDKKYTYMSLTAIKMFKDKPLLGHGVKSFRFNCKKEPYKIDIFDNYNFRLNCGNHPHNTYLQLISETGIIGFSFIFFFFLYILLSLIKNFYNFKKKNFKKSFDFKICILACIFINLFPFTTTGNFFNNWLTIVYFFPIGILFYLNKNYKA